MVGHEADDVAQRPLLAAVGGGSHGSLHANDSLGSLLWCGTGPSADSREQWALRDVTPMILRHFGDDSA